MTNEAALNEAEAKIRQALATLAELLPGKARAYGDAHSLQLDLWRVFLRQYRDPHGMQYTIPEALLAHMPRLTRLLDRMLRIVANPAVDPHGEDPWMDAAGDCVAGMAMPKVAPEEPHIPRALRPYLHAGGAFARPGVPYHGPGKPLAQVFAELEAQEGDTAQGRASHVVDTVTQDLAHPVAGAAEQGLVHCDAPGCPYHGRSSKEVPLPCPTDEPATCRGVRVPAQAQALGTERGGMLCGAGFHTIVGARRCVLLRGHMGPHHDGMGLRSDHTYEELAGRKQTDEHC